MNALPLVSVVVPNYNYKRYLNLRIQSILQQTYQNIERFYLMMPQQTVAKRYYRTIKTMPK